VSGASALRISVADLSFQNPIVLAAGTAGYGEELERVMSVDSLGGLVTKAVSAQPRSGAPAPRVAEFEGGMIQRGGAGQSGTRRGEPRKDSVARHASA
jgi:dihydroorotate dehydrogenase (NAD+) catalytic subunit